MTIGAETFFSTDYYEARARFLAAGQRAGAVIKSALHPTAKGPGGRDLHMDCLQLGPDAAENVLIVISGTHGPEGYCGSGLQTGLLETGTAAAFASRGIKVVMVHAHNPYGFAWDNRFNEDNIDLNRNYLSSFQPPLPPNDHYVQLAEWAAPATHDAQTMAEAERNLLAFAGTHGFAALQAAVSGGQYSHPKGVYFGGFAPSWSHKTLLRFLSDATAGADKVVSIDMHTGLGPFGHGEIITEAAPDSPHFQRQSQIWGTEICSTKDGTSVSANLSGTMDTTLATTFAPAWCACIAIEFGTLDPMAVFRSTQGSSWLHCYGDREGPEAEAIRAASRAAFYPETDAWKQAVWARSLDVISKAADFMAHA